MLTTKEVDEPIAAFLADGAYDTDAVTTALKERHPWIEIIVSPRVTAVLSEDAQSNPTQRDQHIRDIAKYGRSSWQKRSGYMIRSRIENSIGRFKQVLGDTLKSKTDENQASEIDVAMHVLNRMLSLGRPHSVRVT